MLNDAESMVRETAWRLADDLSPKGMPGFAAFDAEKAWKALEDTGFVNLRVSESVGGGDGSTVMAALVVEALAAKLVPVPYLGSALAIELLIAAGAASEVFERISSGDVRVTLGMNRELTGIWSGKGDPVAFDGTGATAVVVLDNAGRGVRAIAPAAAGTGADLTRSVVRGDPNESIELGQLGSMDDESSERFLARALSLLAADLVGVMSAALDMAVEHASTREQFGVAIGTFQALQHLAAEQLISLEGARSLAEYAAWMADEPSTSEALLAARTANAYASRAGRTLCEAVIQIHGGIGITWECLAHVYLKRALLDALLFGDFRAQIDGVTALRRRARSR